VEYILIVHESRVSEFWDHFKTMDTGWLPRWGRFTVVVNHLRDCVVDQSNEGMKAASGEIIIGAMDDLFAPDGWDTKLSALCPDTSKPVALHCLQKNPRDHEIFNPACHTKVLQDLLGPISPEYESMCCDDEYTLHVKRLGVVVKTGLVFEHRHPSFGTAEEDEVYAIQNREEAYRIGQEVFERRRLQNFPRVELPGFPKMEPKPKLTILNKAANGVARFLNPAPVSLPRRNIAVCLPGETFGLEWLAGIFSVQGVLDELGFNFQVFLGHFSGAHVTRIALAESVLKQYGGDPSCPYVLWIDDDNIVPIETMRRWVSAFDSNPQMDILVGWCWIQAGPVWHPSVALFDHQQQAEWMPLTKIFEGGPEIREIENLCSGFPCVMMRREVLESLGPMAFSLIPNPALRYGLLGEDFSFFLRAKQKGFRAFLDPMGKVGHFKTIQQEPTVIYENADSKLQGMLDQVNGRPVEAPEEYRNVGA
jgi:hypothetical protein